MKQFSLAFKTEDTYPILGVDKMLLCLRFNMMSSEMLRILPGLLPHQKINFSDILFSGDFSVTLPKKIVEIFSALLMHVQIYLKQSCF